MDKIIRIGIDTSKHVFQLHGVNAAERPVLRKKMRRKEMIDFFTTCPPTVIAIEAWRFTSLGSAADLAWA